MAIARRFGLTNASRANKPKTRDLHTARRLGPRALCPIPGPACIRCSAFHYYDALGSAAFIQGFTVQ